MDLRDLACFVAVAEELHFHRAAARLHLTQPALSMRIKALEAEVGIPLLNRDRRSVALTPAGAAFLDHARAAVRHAGEAREGARRVARGEAGRLRLGFTAIAFYRALPEAVRVYRERFPDVTVELKEMTSPEQETALAAGDLDVGVLHPPLAAPGLVTFDLPDEELVLAVPAGHRLARVRCIGVSDLAGEPFLMAPRRVGPHFHDRITALFGAAGASPRVVQEAMPMPTLIGLVAAGIGIGFVARSLAVIRRPGVVYRPLSTDPPRLPFALAWRSGSAAPLVPHFVEIVTTRAVARQP